MSKQVSNIAVENPKQISEQVERLKMLAERIASSSANVGARVEPILSAKTEDEDAKTGSPPYNGHAPLSSTLKEIADGLEESLFRLDSIYDRVEL